MDSESGDLSEDLSPVGGESFNARKLALQAQKKILSKMATKMVASLLIDETSSDILDELYNVTREYTGDKKEAHRVLKDLIKVALKIGILYRNSQFNQEEGETADRFKKKLNQAAMTAVSFYEVEFTFDTQVLAMLLNECRDLLHRLVERHLTLKSHGRIDRVFRLFASSDFLCTLYNPRGVHRSNLQKICAGVNKLLDEGVL